MTITPQMIEACAREIYNIAREKMGSYVAPLLDWDNRSPEFQAETRKDAERVLRAVAEALQP